MAALSLHQIPVLVSSSSRKKLPLLPSADCSPTRTTCSSSSLQCRGVLKSHSAGISVRANASSASVGSRGYAENDENDNQSLSSNDPKSDSSSHINKLPNETPVSIVLMLSVCALVFSIIAFGKGAHLQRF